MDLKQIWSDAVSQASLMLSAMKMARGKKAMGNVNTVVYALIGILIVVVLITAVAPTMFNGTSNITGAPSFFNTIFPILIAAALIFLMWRAISA